MKNLCFLGALCLGLTVFVSAFYNDNKASEIDSEIEALVRALKERKEERALGGIDPDDLTDEELLALAGIDTDDADVDDEDDDLDRREMLYQGLRKRLTPHPDQWPPIRLPPWGWPRPWPPWRLPPIVLNKDRIATNAITGRRK